jgi:S1-C subfamily serine protease
VRILTLSLLLALAACSSPQDDTTTPRTTGSDQTAALPPSGPAIGGEIPTVPREQLDRVLGQSVGDFLNRHVEVEPDRGEGGFAGWRIVRLVADPAPWLDLRVDDVVVAINRLPLERPDDAQQAWETLRISSEVLIDLRRDGSPLSIRIPIGEDDAAPEPPLEE